MAHSSLLTRSTRPEERHSGALQETRCREGKPIHRDIKPITDLKPSQKGIIAFLRGGQKVIQRLSDLGLTPHTEVTLVRKTPMGGPIEVMARRTTLAVGRDIADNIFVEAVGAQ